MSTNKLLAIAALVAAILSFVIAGPLLAVAVILLALALLV
jgi:hypothetical protein